ncbi:PAS domain S-box protein [Chryseolinea sp. T2]|uniref:PAS domain-containing sensor histidine kinase n=1 Tax=Chryseolinea sp. T2 TaxID=3129255 RepID=UPI0030776D89
MSAQNDNGKGGNTPGIENAYQFFAQAPVVIGFVRGGNYIVEFANEGLLKIWKTDSAIYGKRLFDVFPELESQGFRHLLDNVRTTGNAFTAYEYPMTFERGDAVEVYYFDFIYQPFYEAGQIAGVIAVGHDVTEKVNAKKLIERGDRKWKQLANSLPVIVWTSDEKGNLDFFNELWYETTGLTREESMGSGWTKALHPEDIDRCTEAWNEALKRRTFYEIEARYRNKNGSYRWVLARGIPVIENDMIVSWHGTSTDISGQKSVEGELKDLVMGRNQQIEEKENLLKSILENSTNGISVSKLLFDEQGHVVDAHTILANDSAVKYIGIPREEYLTKPATHFDPNIIASPYGQACIRTLLTGEPFIMRYFLDFSRRWLELTVSKMDDAHLIHHFTDVTAIREAEMKLEKTLEDLRYSNANLEEFAYAASHDLKEPIRKTQFFVSRLREELKHSLNVEQSALFERLEKTQARMKKLIEDLLEYSQSAKGEADQENIDLNDAIHTVLEDLELEIERKSATVNIGKLPAIFGNKRQMHQLFQNLIGNALKYCRVNVPCEIRIAAETLRGSDVRFAVPENLREQVFHLISVSDNGIGFDQMYAESIFKVFARLHSEEEYRGSGIGLSIVKKVVESHHGTVWAESKPGEGAVFFILLPI